MAIRRAGHHASSGRPAEESDLHQVRLIHVLDGDGLLADRRRDGLQPDGAAFIVFDHRGQQQSVYIVEPQLVDLHPIGLLFR